jgi:putative nucleotidyltransferase with HDIG domain
MLSLLTRSKPKPVAPTTDTPSPGRRLVADLDQLESLPHLSDTAVQAMTLANSPDATLAEMVNVIRRDGMMASAVLKLANSAVYRGSGEVTELQQAVVRIGFRGCGNLISGIGMKSIYDRHPPGVQEACEGVLKHSLFVASLASAVNRVAHIGLQGEEFTAGLLHDIGRVVLCVKAPDVYAAAGVPEHDDGDVRAAERAAFGTDHCSVGGLFAIKNNLPTRLGRVILNHHHPADEGDYRDLVGLVALADALANHIQLHHNATGFDAEADPGYLTLRSVVDADRLERFRAMLPKIVVHSVKETRGMLKSMYR